MSLCSCVLISRLQLITESNSQSFGRNGVNASLSQHMLHTVVITCWDLVLMNPTQLSVLASFHLFDGSFLVLLPTFLSGDNPRPSLRPVHQYKVASPFAPLSSPFLWFGCGEPILSNPTKSWFALPFLRLKESSLCTWGSVSNLQT